MAALVFAGVAVVFGINWIGTRIGAEALVYYMEKKGYTPPTDKEVEECTRYVVMRRFKKRPN